MRRDGVRTRWRASDIADLTVEVSDPKVGSALPTSDVPTDAQTWAPTSSATFFSTSRALRRSRTGSKSAFVSGAPPTSLERAPPRNEALASAAAAGPPNEAFRSTWPPSYFLASRGAASLLLKSSLAGAFWPSHERASFPAPLPSEPLESLLPLRPLARSLALLAAICAAVSTSPPAPPSSTCSAFSSASVSGSDSADEALCAPT
mmetsp:Transcript_11216/g.34543  ORF Transcript_11216/g.34543 Transcript_11216/m.34543 type:complete len:205 (+) Transcript_11216:1140-1754(+)